jgi:NitT/TauT family transport system permease protein
MMVAVFVLMIVGVILSAGIHRMQAHLLRWQPQYRDK